LSDDFSEIVLYVLYNPEITSSTASSKPTDVRGSESDCQAGRGRREAS
jgi:hypothetical protein